jgi:photosystem II stability/assembly factor-like uncharacterized protein
MRSRSRCLLATTLLVPLAVAAVGSARPLPAAPGAPVQVRSATFDRTPSPAELGLTRQAPDDSGFLTQRGRVPVGAYEKARLQSLAVRSTTAAAAPDVAKAEWRLEGPTNIGGRILDIVVDADQPDTIFALPASGGVWKSTDAGRTFTPSWPSHYTQAMGAMAIGPDGTLWVGTGEAGPGGGSITYAGNGVYKSTDKGRTWTNVGLPESGRVGRIVVHPTDPSTVFVAATGNLFVEGGERGLYRTTDAGATWELVAEGDNARTGAADVAIDPNNPDNVLVTMWENFRTPSRRYYTGLGSGIYRSTDGGDTFTRTGLPAFAPNAGQGRIGIAYAPTEPNKVYAYTSTELGAFAGFYTSLDGGTTFTGVGAGVPLVTGSFVYGWWFGRLYVDPNDADRVFATGVSLAETTDGGLTWGTSGAGTHADHHAMAWDPNVEGRIYNGNDGGVYRSDDNGSNWEFATYQPWSQFYSVDVDANDSARIVGGLQDNGVNRSFGPDGTGPASWDEYVGGDGEAAVIDYENGDILYGCSQYGACSVSMDGGETTSGFTYEDEACAPLAGCPRANWFSPVVLDPVDPSIVYTGHFSLFRSTEHGKNFKRISTTVDFSNGPPPTNSEPNPLFRHYATISTIAVTDMDTGVILVGTDDGNVWRSTDAGATFTKLASDAFVDGQFVTRVAIDLADPQKMYATFSGYRSGDNAPHVVSSTDGGDTWTDISANLPNAPVNDIVVVGSDLAVATDVGVFVSRDAGGSWLAVGTELPMVPVTDISYHAKTDRLYAATYGRSIYSAGYPRGAGAPAPQPPAAPRPKPRPVTPSPLPSTGLASVVPVLALLLVGGGTAVALRRRRRNA